MTGLLVPSKQMPGLYLRLGHVFLLYPFGLQSDDPII